jgi:hypothetical protein
LKIFSFPKYSICGAAAHKAHFFFHWIDLHYPLSLLFLPLFSLR